MMLRSKGSSMPHESRPRVSRDAERPMTVQQRQLDASRIETGAVPCRRRCSRGAQQRQLDASRIETSDPDLIGWQQRQLDASRIETLDPVRPRHRRRSKGSSMPHESRRRARVSHHRRRRRAAKAARCLTNRDGDHDTLGAHMVDVAAKAARCLTNRDRAQGAGRIPTEERCRLASTPPGPHGIPMARVER